MPGGPGGRRCRAGRPAQGGSGFPRWALCPGKASAAPPGGPVGCCGWTRAGSGRASRSFPVTCRITRRRALSSVVAGSGGELSRFLILLRNPPRAQVSRGRRGGGLCPACSFVLRQLRGVKAQGRGRFSCWVAGADGGVTPGARLLLAVIADVRCWSCCTAEPLGQCSETENSK